MPALEPDDCEWVSMGEGWLAVAISWLLRTTEIDREEGRTMLLPARFRLKLLSRTSSGIISFSFPFRVGIGSRAKVCRRLVRKETHAGLRLSQTTRNTRMKNIWSMTASIEGFAALERGGEGGGEGRTCSGVGGG